MRRLAVLHDRSTQAASILSAACLGLSVLAYCFEIVTRYFLNAPTKWAGAVTLYMLLISVMLMLPHLTRNRAHVSVTYIADRAGPRFQRLISVSIAVLASLVCLGAGLFAARESYRAYLQGVNTTDAMRIPVWWLLVFVIYGMLSAAIHFARQTVDRTPPHSSGIH